MKPYRQVTVTNATYLQIFDGRKEAWAVSSAAWRLSDSASPGAGEFIQVAANQPVPLAKFVSSFARGESGSATINIGDIL
jgi:hypothetical protein